METVCQTGSACNFFWLERSCSNSDRAHQRNPFAVVMNVFRGKCVTHHIRSLFSTLGLVFITAAAVYEPLRVCPIYLTNVLLPVFLPRNTYHTRGFSDCSYWIFAHNGDVPSAKDPAKKGFFKTRSTRYTPVGDTDSETVFCYFLNNLLDIFPNGTCSTVQQFSS